MAQNSSLAILVVSASRGADSLIDQIEGRDGIHVTTVQTIEAAVGRLRTATVDCLVCDSRLPDGDGITLLEIVRAWDPRRPVIVRLDEDETSAVDRAIAAQATDIVRPGDETESIVALVESVARRHRTRATPRPDPEAALDSAPDPIVVAQTGAIVYANSAAGDQFGISETGEADGRFDFDGDDLQAWARQRETGDRPFETGTVTVRTPESRELRAEYAATDINWHGGPATVVVSTGVADEHAGLGSPSVRNTESDGEVLDDAAYRQLFRDAINGIAIQRVVTDRDGRAVDYVFEDVNAAFERITGLTAGEIQGKRGSDVFDLPEDPTEDPFITRYGDVALQDRRIEFEAYSEPLDQHHRVTAYPLDGNRIAAVFIDITDRVEATAELATYEEIVQRVGDPIMLQDREGAFQLVNDALVEYAGIPRAELLGSDEFAFMDEQTAERIQEMKARVLETEQPVNYNTSPTLQGRRDRSFATTRYPQYDDTGDVVGTIAICRDVTHLKNQERQLQVFSRLLRHNLRNDLNVITGNAEVLRERVQEPLTATADRILATGEEVIDLIDTERHIVELLTEDVQRTVLPIRPLLTAAVETVQASYPEGEIEFQCPLDARITAVPLLENAFAELIENGIEHNDSETPRVTVEVTREGDAVRVDIRDDGPGIPAEERAVLTDQVEPSPLLHSTGLGLWLVRYSVAHVGGSLQFGDAESGTHVVVTLPIVEE